MAPKTGPLLVRVKRLVQAHEGVGGEQPSHLRRLSVLLAILLHAHLRVDAATTSTAELDPRAGL